MNFKKKNVKDILIAIDGPSASGKSTTAKKLAKKLGLIYIDTGAMYRAVGLFFLNKKEILENEKIVEKELGSINIDITFSNSGNKIFLNEKDITERIREEDISKMASVVSTNYSVRKKMVDLQREIGQKGGVVLDGRDIGTVVFPNADCKIFMEADVLVRAKRRFQEISLKDKNIILDDIVKELKWRDKNDSERKISPLRKADDAIVVNTTYMNIDEQVERILEIIRNNNKFKIN